MPEIQFSPPKTPVKTRILRPELLLILIVAMTVFRPGDASWVNDEPIMMEMAIRYNDTASNLYGFYLPFTPAPYGLEGTRGAHYGPLPIWFDQIMLAMTHNVVVILACRAAFFSAVTALALYWLTRTLRLSPWFAVVTMLSPWLWLLSRSLWDSSWCIPISALLLASLAAFLEKSSRFSLGLMLVCFIFLPLVHFQALAIIAPVGLHLLIFHYHRLWRWKWMLGTIAVVCLYPFWPYLLFFMISTHPHGGEYRSALLGWLFPLLGGHYLTLGVAGTTPGDGWQINAPKNLRLIVAVAQWISRIALPVVWLGMALAVWRAWQALCYPRRVTAREHLCLLALAVWICQTILDGLERIYFGPQYYAATWIVYALLAWIAVDWMMRRSLWIRLIAAPALWIYGGSLVIGVSIIAVTIARNAGTAGGYYGTTLENQIAAVKRIRQFSDRSEIEMQFPPWRLHPWAFTVLMELNPPSQRPLAARRLVVKYRAAYPGDARIEVQTPSGA